MGRSQLTRRCGMVTLLLIASALASRSGAEAPSAVAPPLRFDSEVVRLYISGDTLDVAGVYLFACHPGARLTATLFYPFPEDSLLGDTEMISVECRPLAGGEDDWQPVPFETTQHRPGARWWVPLDRGDSLIVHARYRQKLLGNYARYILTSTQAWGEPLRHARFEVWLPGGAQLLHCSYPLERQRDPRRALLQPGQSPLHTAWCYVFEITNFMPTHDLTIEWSR